MPLPMTQEEAFKFLDQAIVEQVDIQQWRNLQMIS